LGHKGWAPGHRDVTQQQESYRDMISKVLLTELPCLLAVMQKLTSRLANCGSWITKNQ